MQKGAKCTEIGACLLRVFCFAKSPKDACLCVSFELRFFISLCFSTNPSQKTRVFACLLILVVRVAGVSLRVFACRLGCRFCFRKCQFKNEEDTLFCKFTIQNHRICENMDLLAALGPCSPPIGGTKLIEPAPRSPALAELAPTVMYVSAFLLGAGQPTASQQPVAGASPPASRPPVASACPSPPPASGLRPPVIRLGPLGPYMGRTGPGLPPKLLADSSGEGVGSVC